jgi:hypothetical protein
MHSSRITLLSSSNKGGTPLQRFTMSSIVRSQYPSPFPEVDVDVDVNDKPVGAERIPEKGIYDPTTPKAEVKLPVHVPEGFVE